MSILCNHQPHFMPSVQYFARLRIADIFVFADCVEWEKQDWQNRNRILCKDGKIRWIVAPVKKGDFQLIEEKVLDQPKQNLQKVANLLQDTYRREAGWMFIEQLIKLLTMNNHSMLVDLDIAVAKWAMNVLEIPTMKLKKESDLPHPLDMRRSEFLAWHCSVLGCDTYMHGKGCLSYLDVEPFEKWGIKLQQDKWEPKEYEQVQSVAQSFIPNLSIVDLIGRMGTEANDYLGECV